MQPRRNVSHEFTSESQLQDAICYELARLGIWAYRVCAEARAPWTRDHGAPPGTPDIRVEADWGGWLEVKMPGKKLQKEQVFWHQRAIRVGTRIDVVRSLEEAIEVVLAWRKAGP